MPAEHVTAWLMLLSLAAYALMGGADLGAGVWDLLASGPRKQRQRQVLARAIGPVWEANHVWMIAVVVFLFTAFPPAYAAIMTALHVPVTLALLGIVARGTSFVFRTYSVDHDRSEARWGRVFSVASTVTPVLLGVALGTIASGRLHWENGVYVSGFFAPWCRAFPFAVGFLTLAIFSFLGAVYICAEIPADEPELQEDFRRRGLGNGVAVGLTAAVTWTLAYDGAPELSQGLSSHGWAWPLQIATGLVAVGAMASLWRRRYLAARAFAVGQIGLIVLGYGAALFPYLVVPDFTLANTAAPPQTQHLVQIAFIGGAVLLLPSLYVLYRVFKGQRAFQVIEGNR